MNYQERLNEANEALYGIDDRLFELEKEAIQQIKHILMPCGEHGCLIGSEDFCDDIYYVYAEPKPNEFYRITAIRNKEGKAESELEVCIDLPAGGDYSNYGLDEEGWMSFEKAHIADIRFLIEEIRCNLEYSDGYQPEDDDTNLIDEDGNPYVVEKSCPAGGGMDNRCDYNAEALYAFNVLKGYDNIVAYLTKKDFVPGCQSDQYEEWFKGNTKIVFELYDSSLKNYAYMHTELLEEPEVKKTKRYAVPFLRTQWADVYVDATSPEEAIEKAEAVFNESHDGWVDWEDIDSPEYDECRGVEDQK